MKRLVSIVLVFLIVLSAVQPVFATETGIVGFKAVSGDEKVTLTWSTFRGAEDYDIYWKRASSEDWKIAGTVKKTSVNITGLKNGVSYNFKIATGDITSEVLTISPSYGDKITVTDSTVDKYTCESAVESVKNMRAGWCLGNTLDATGDWYTPTPENSETCWGNPVTTKKMLEAVKKEGFNAVRVPVTWKRHIDENGTIDEEWLTRVHEVVDYVIDSGMYCIINIHHDTGSDGWIYASDAGFEAACDKVEAIWRQVAEEFSEYGEKLIFENLNEMLNRQNGDWWTNDREAFDAMTKYHQLFVDTVRSAGGYNAERNLIVSDYASSSSSNIVEAFKLPKDTVDGHLIMEVHYYEPAGFCNIEASWTTVRDDWGTAQDKKDIDNFIDMLSKQANKLGVPAIVGEFGSQAKDNDLERAEHAAYFVKAASEKGIRVFWWDDGGNFKLLDRENLKFLHREITKALVNNAE